VVAINSIVIELGGWQYAILNRHKILHIRRIIFSKEKYSLSPIIFNKNLTIW